MTDTTYPGRPFPYTKSRSNTVIQSLREEGPQLSGSLAFDPSPNARSFIGQISPPWGGEDVCYLWGDERRAMRLFVDEYEDKIREAMDTTNSTLATRLDDSMWRLLCEEWLWSGKLTDDEIRKYQARESDEEVDDAE